MLQNIDDSLNCFAFVGAHEFTQARGPIRVAEYQRPNSEAIQGAEQRCAVVTDAPMAQTLFEPLRSFPKRLVDKWRMGESARQIADENGVPVGTSYVVLRNKHGAIVRVSESGREGRYPLRGKTIQYVDPIEPVADEDWEALR